ncbi:DUF5682 family protein [Labrenzia sp. VG12]|uniref:DUF5682 family protein n=1 Tax=Labrenzia sp. VG12 TaxID=2021862 RepID=UPI000B8C4DED|nr:DUF5682 family protein [Labrenzia sp. VG12]ASP31857.1 hypothetical protein CHH27_00235 [Labrenzia sp. VG12]
MTANVSYFGIRHHGPGSARRLLDALDDLRPAEVLVEGPADLSALLPTLASLSMKPPVALLAYPVNEPERAAFWPFAEFSPEYQAVCWAVCNHVPVRFIDLPVYWNFQPDEAEDSAQDSDAEETGDVLQLADRDDAFSDRDQQLRRDPIGALAEAAGYEDGESWWQDVIEENPAPGPVFEAVADAMSTLRAHAGELPGREAAREAHMRLEIGKSLKQADGPVAVVCGAWHVPALQAKHTAKADRALLKGASKVKIAATWAPWTAPRLATSSGYGAGVAAPGWCLHLWQTPGDDKTTRWIARIAKALRAEGQIVSTASLIETERLAVSLAAVRGRPQPGYEELREAAISCLCFGNPLIFDTISAELLIGSDTGAIPDDVPLAPLLEDLQRQQKKARLKPEALERELSLDLRSDSGLFRSTLLHRLSILDVPWGRPLDPGKSRGTFRERWVLRWEPVHAVQLVENLVYGASIEQAASGKTKSRLRESHALGALADLVFGAMTAQLSDAADEGVRLLGARAGQTSDCSEMLSALPALADILRYGAAREIDTVRLHALFDRIATQAALSLPYAVRNLDAEASQALRSQIQGADGAIRLLDDQPDLQGIWQKALEAIIEEPQANRLISGLAARLLYEADLLSSDAAVDLLARMLSPGTAVQDAAAYFAGFLEGAGQRLLYDDGLRRCVDTWLLTLEEDDFTEFLPLFRRVFASMDKTERRRLMDALFGNSVSGGSKMIATPDAETRWPAHLDILTRLLKGEAHG